MNPVRIPRQRTVRWPRWFQRLQRMCRCVLLRAHIAQLQELQARPDLWDSTDKLQRDLLEAHLAELRCELTVLEMQR